MISPVNSTGCFTVRKDSSLVKHVETGEVEVESYGKMEVVVVSHTPKMSDDVQSFKVILRNSYARFILYMNPSLLQHFSDSSIYQAVKLDTKTFLKIIRTVLLEKDESIFKPKFMSCYEENSRNQDSKVQAVSKSKRRKIQTYNDEFFLVLNLECNPQPSDYFKPFQVCLKFQYLPYIDISFIPNEILIEVFQNLESRFLLKIVCLVSHRFHQLIESEYMYKKHHFSILIGDFLKEGRNEGEKWKDFTLRMWERRISWEKDMIKTDPSSSTFWNVEEIRELVELRRKGRYMVIGQLTEDIMDGLSMYAITGRYFSLDDTSFENSVTWKVRMRREFIPKETQWRKYWIGLVSRERQSCYLYDPLDGFFCYDNVVKRESEGKSMQSKKDKKGNITLDVVLLKSGLIKFECEDISNVSRNILEFGNNSTSTEFCLCAYVCYRSSVTELEIISLDVE